jgi:acetyl-CoA carboxylase biotin carboxylase subunit
VEHPITELCTGVDFVEQMIRIAAGQPLGFSQDAIVRRGAAIECRVYAEDPRHGFLPSPGRIKELAVPGGPGVRDDSSARAGGLVSAAYDPLISKLCVWGADRGAALARMRRALGEYVVTGIHTNLSFLSRLVSDDRFVRGVYDTTFVERHLDELMEGCNPDGVDLDAIAAALALAVHERDRLRQAPPARGTVSGWLAAHRARLRSR